MMIDAAVSTVQSSLAVWMKEIRAKLRFPLGYTDQRRYA